VWRVNRAPSKSSTPGPDEPRLIEPSGGVPHMDSKQQALTER
jgi:hypothetical protein